MYPVGDKSYITVGDLHVVVCEVSDSAGFIHLEGLRRDFSVCV